LLQARAVGELPLLRAHKMLFASYRCHVALTSRMQGHDNSYARLLASISACAAAVSQ
jgi:hypothetical protein